MSLLKAYKAYYFDKDYDLCLKLLDNLKTNDKNPKPSDTIYKLDLQAQAEFKKRNYQEALNVYEQIFNFLKASKQYPKSDDGNNDARKGNVALIVACAQIEKENEIKTSLVKQIPSKESVIRCVETIKTSDNVKEDKARELFADKLNTEKKRKKHLNKKRKKRLPKSYDPIAGPDPERWLARRDRTKVSKALKKRDKAKNQAMRGAQGAVPTAASEKLTSSTTAPIASNTVPLNSKLSAQLQPNRQQPTRKPNRKKGRK